MSRNVDISDPSFSKRLMDLRRKAALGRRDLANVTGLTPRTIGDLERGTRHRVQERTLIVLAEALGVTYEVLLGLDCPPPATIQREHLHRVTPRRWRGVVVPLGLIACLGWISWNWAVFGAELHIEEGSITVTDHLYNRVLWNDEYYAPIRAWRMVPGGGQDLLAYGLDAADGGKLIVREVRTGKLVWQDAADSEKIAAVYGQEMADMGGFHCCQVTFADLEGDEEPELIALFMHQKWYPSFVRSYSRDGTILGTFYNQGHLSELCVGDLDNNGTDEVLAIGTNNNSEYQGATVVLLDAEHNSGAAVDSDASGSIPFSDGSRVRLIFPQFEKKYMDHLSGARIQVRGLETFPKPGGATLIMANVGTLDGQLIITLDNELRPLSVSPSDAFVKVVLSWPECLWNILQQDKLDQWLASTIRFETGRRQPSLEPTAKEL